jgi:hypothetical protein
MLVFMGNFSAAATPGSADADYVGLREGFTRLARLIDTYAAIKVREVQTVAVEKPCVVCSRCKGRAQLGRGTLWGWERALHVWCG